MQNIVVIYIINFHLPPHEFNIYLKVNFRKSWNANFKPNSLVLLL
jgi:hypothetical protein